MDPTEQDKTDAYRFLLSLKNSFSDMLPAPQMEIAIRQTMAMARLDKGDRHLRMPEATFINSQVVPRLFQHLHDDLGFDVTTVRESLLTGCHPCMRDISRGTPIRTVRHPFTKAVGQSTAAIYSRWANAGDASSLTASCPKFALRRPFPHKVVFEGLYFSNGLAPVAQKELVNSIYQAFLYRGLPFVPPTKRRRVAWDYDYSCVVAYDASPKGTLKFAWDALPDRIRNGFWHGAQVYVMVLGGQGRPVTRGTAAETA